MGAVIAFGCPDGGAASGYLAEPDGARAGVPHPWPVPPLPAVIGFEGVGVVEEVGAEVRSAGAA